MLSQGYEVNIYCPSIDVAIILFCLIPINIRWLIRLIVGTPVTAHTLNLVRKQHPILRGLLPVDEPSMEYRHVHLLACQVPVGRPLPEEGLIAQNAAYPTTDNYA
jgi:hypothetical protein